MKEAAKMYQHRYPSCQAFINKREILTAYITKKLPSLMAGQFLAFINCI